MVKVYLDTCIPFKPLRKIDPEKPDPEWDETRANKTFELISLIGLGQLTWSTSDIFFAEFSGLTIRNQQIKDDIDDKPALKVFLKSVNLLAQKAERIFSHAELIADAEELADLSGRPGVTPLSYADAQHIISSFKAQVDKFLTYDHRSILNNHKEGIDEKGKEYNPVFSAEDPVDTCFP